MRDTEADTGLLIAQVRRALAVEWTTLAPDIRHRLQVARRAALARSCAPTWPWLAGALTASVIALASVVVRMEGLSTDASLAALEATAIADDSADDLAVSEELDFYQWLARRESSG